MKNFPFMAVITLLALCFLSLIYGAVSVHMHWWPSKLVTNAGQAAIALLAVQEEEFSRDWPTSMEFIDAEASAALPILQHAEYPGTAEDLFFVDGGSQQLRSHCPSNGCLAWLMDRSGAIRHVWSIGSELIWEDLQNVQGFSRAQNIYSVGAHPFPNGDLLVTYQGRNTYPYGVGMARFDKDSNLLWKKENFAHHWFSVDAEGHIYVPSFAPVTTPYLLGDTNLSINCEGGVLQQDVILVLDSNGNEIERISLLDTIVESGYAGIVFQAVHSDRGLPLAYVECDPTHLNDVQLISAADAATSSHLSAGDLLVSLRSSNAILVLDAATRRVKWASAGRTTLQHSPRYMGDNTILLFDNLGGGAAAGGSRLLRIDMDTQQTSTVFPAERAVDAGSVLSVNGGYIGLSDDRSRALMSLTRQGRTLEIELATGRLLWEFRNVHDVSAVVDKRDGDYARFATQTVIYFNQADFAFNGGKP
jgi:hypothetical protein